MADLVRPVIDLVDYLCDFRRSHTSYVRNLEENLAYLRNAMEKLKNVRDHVKRRVELAEAQGMVRIPVVGGWLERVEAVEAQVNSILQQGSTQLEQSCIKGCCPPNICWKNYKLGKKILVKMLPILEELYGGRQFKQVADRSNPTIGQERPDSPNVGIEPMLEKAMKLIEDDEVNILGIYGMGGVGKTTLLNKINNELLLKFRKNRDDDVVVILVVVSRELNLGRIQCKIGKRLGLSDRYNERDNYQLQEEQSQAIFNILLHKKFLLLLDDCWERVDLKSIGIPPFNTQAPAGSKVIFTTRSEVVCGQMEAKKKMRVECLDPSKAWQLFEEKVGEAALTINFDPQVRELAEDVVKECCGLPLALISVGRTMATKKTQQEWKHAITVLKKYASKFSVMKDEVFPLLKFSYDNLHNDAIRSCFLYCSLYPEDYNIEKEELIKHWIGEGFLDGFESMDEAYDEGNDIIGSLKAVCLLEGSGVDDGEGYVKMHDVVRDLAVSIGCEGKRPRFLIQAGANLSKAPPSEEWKEVERVSLMCNGICSLGDDVPITCSNLSTLLLQSNHSLQVIKGNFFQLMPTLKVLNLSCTKITHLPTSISILVELQLLDLSTSAIEELSMELKNLVKLTYLDLSYTRKLRRIPLGVISGLSNLQMLNLHGSGYSNWENEEFGDTMSLQELERLECLSALGLNIRDSTAGLIQKFFLNEKFQVCTRHLEIVNCPTLVSVTIPSPSLLFAASTSALPLVSSSTSSDSLKLCVMKNLKTFAISDCPEMKYLNETDGIIGSLSSLETLSLSKLPKLTFLWRHRLHKQQYFQKLQHVLIYDCNALNSLSWTFYAPNLKVLRIFSCHELHCLLYDHLSNESMIDSFSRLKNLELGDLRMLYSICDRALPFPSLELISVRECPLLTKLPFDNNSAQKTLRRIQGSVEWWNQLQWKDDIVKDSFLKYFEPPDW